MVFEMSARKYYPGIAWRNDHDLTILGSGTYHPDIDGDFYAYADAHLRDAATIYSEDFEEGRERALQVTKEIMDRPAQIVGVCVCFVSTFSR